MDTSTAFLEHNTPYRASDRPKRDVGWARVLAVFVSLSILGGVLSALHWNPAFFRLLTDSGFASNPASCPAHHAGSGGYTLLLAGLAKKGGGANPPPPTIDPFSRLASTGALLLGASALAAAGLSFGILYGFRRAAPSLTLAVVRLQVVVPLVGATLALFSGAISAAVGLFLIAGLAAWAIHLWRGEIGLCARLLGLAAACVVDVPGLVGAAAATTAAAGAAAGVMGAAAVAALANGSLLANPSVSSSSPDGGCRAASGAPIPCCAWAPAPIAPLVALLALLSAAWCTATAGQARTFIISGAAAAWWYAPRADSGGGEGADSLTPSNLPRPLLVGATRRAASHAVGPSAGSLAMGGAVMTAANGLRAMLNAASSSQDGEGPGILYSLFAAIAGGLLELLAVLTKYATVAAAITGDSLLDAGRAATALLKQQSLSALGVWYFPPLVLHAYVGLAAIMAGAGAGGLYAVTAPAAKHGATGDDYAQTVLTHAVALGVAAALLVVAIVGFATSVLLSAVDALFFTWALDRATGGGAVTRPDAAAVFEAVPCGVVVEQPDGGLAYGAGGGGGRRRYVPPSQMPAGGAPV